MKRRTFLGLGAAAAGATTLVAEKTFSQTIHTKPARIIVLGAGFSGLSAALKLHDAKVDFVVLESRNRVGGRVFTHVLDDVHDLRVELGAEWVGKSHEEVQKLCKRFDIELLNNQFETDLLFRGSYQPSDQWEFTEEWKKRFEEIIKNFKQLSDAQQRELDRMDWWRFLVNNGIPENDLFLRELLDSTDFGESIRHVSGFSALSEYAESSKKNEMDFKMKGGNGTLSRKITEYIGSDKIKLGYHVEAIEQKNGKVKVTCTNGETFEADRLICTIPTFSLAKIKFTPALPKEKMDAINALQYARINKHAVLFSERFWGREDFDLITDTSAHYFYHATKNQPSKSGALISYSIGEKADVFGWNDDHLRKQMVLESLRPIARAEDYLQKQVNYYWGTDRYSKGSYAVYGKGQWFGLRPILAEKFVNIHFAGEHIADWQGFMEGAVSTGAEAAEAALS